MSTKPENELYVYTTPTYSEKKLIKVGQCAVGRHRDRINEQFGTSNPERPEILWVHSLPDGKTDHDIHARLEANGVRRIKNGTGREWFEGTVDDVKRAFHQVVVGVSRTESFSLRSEQTSAVEKATAWFQGNYPEEILGAATHRDRFLLNAKMRFGKCFTGLHIAKSVTAKHVLVITYKPEVIPEWLSAANDHIDFSDWTGIRARRPDSGTTDLFLSESGIIPEVKGPLVLCASLQDLAIDQEGKTKLRLEKAVEQQWDLIIFDEVHFGSRTERARFIVDSLKWRYRLDLSGTPFRLVQEDDFCSEQVFTYSYLDEQLNKKLEEERDPSRNLPLVYREMPDLNISTIEITDDDLKQQRETFLTDDLDFSLNELFRTSSKKFVHEQAVDNFIDGLARRGFGARSISIYGSLGDQLGIPAKRHAVWWLNRVDSVRALAKKLSKHPVFSRYSVINAAGADEEEDRDEVIARDKRIVQDRIAASEASTETLGTITLTCRRFLTGVTIKQWDSILVLNDVKAAEAYFQAIFRVQSAWVDRSSKAIRKPKAWVFDFAISRCLRLAYQYGDALADQIDQQDSSDGEGAKDNLTSTIDGLCNSLSLRRFYEGKLESNPVVAADIFEAVNEQGSRVSLAKRITSDALVNFASLRHLEADPHLLNVLGRVKGYRTQEVGAVSDFVQIGIEAERLVRPKQDSLPSDDEAEEATRDFVQDEKDKKKKKRKSWYATQIKRLAICMADFIYLTKFREYNIDHVIQTKDSDFFLAVTGITKDEFTELCSKGFISKLSLNRIVREFRCQEESSLKAEQYILDNLKHSA